MKIAVFFDQYGTFHDAKDGNLIRAIALAGGSPTLVTLTKPELDGYRPTFDIVPLDRDDFVDVDFWKSVDAEAVLAYTWLNPRYTPVIKAMSSAGKRVIIKADSDGRLGPPTPPYWYHRSPPWSRDGATNLARRAAWRLFPQGMARRRLEHLETADAVYFEAATAQANVAAFAAHWGRPELASRLTHIPIVVPELFGEALLPAKERRVACIARWQDRWAKGTEATVRSLSRFLLHRPDYSAVMMGPGEEIVRRILARDHDRVAGRVNVVGPCSRTDVVRHLAGSQIFFMASRFEGFPLSVGEALSMGCSIAGTPIEALRDAVGAGEFGTVATGHDVVALVDTLRREAFRWDGGGHQPDAIALHWREQFAPRRIGGQILALAEALRVGPPQGGANARG